MNIRCVILIVLAILFWRHGFAQYPVSGVKQRLGYQTTGDGLVYRGNGSPAYTPSGINSAWAYIDTTAGTIYTYYAGSWHLVSAGGGTSFDGHVDSLVFNTAVTVTDSVGKMYYDAANETISVGIDGGAVYQLGQELYYPLVINKSGATIHNGQPVMVDTATLVTGDYVRIIPARNGATYPSEYVMGVATTDIPNDSTGLVTWFGYVREVKEADIAQTSVTLNAGDILYISATEPGKYTNVRPSSPAHQSTVALVVRKPSVNNITLLVRPWLAPKLDNLSNVNVTSATGLSVLRYNSTTGTWDASATPGIVAADTAAMLSNYVTLSTNQTITGTKTISNLLQRISGFTQDSFRLDFGAWNVSSAQKIPYTISKGSGYYPSTGAMSTFMSRLNWGAVSDYSNAASFVFMGTNATGVSASSNSAIAEFWNYNTSKALRIMASGKVAFGNFSPNYSLDLYSKTDAIRIPVGTTGQRPTGAAGVVRYNSDNSNLEYHNGTSWNGIQSTISNPVTGTGTAGQVAYWSGTSSQTGSANLTYDGNSILQTSTSSDMRYTLWNYNSTDTSSLSIISNFAGASSTSNANWRGVFYATLPKNYRNSALGGIYTAGGATITMYGGIDTTNNHITHAITNVSAVSETNYNPSFRWVKAVTNNYTIANELMRLNKTGLGIKQNTPLYSLDINATDAIRIPVGTTGQRPTGAAGVVRYNSDNSNLEYHNGTSWNGIQSTISNPVTGTGAAGQVAYWSGTGTQAGSNNLFWDNTNARLGVGTNSPGGKMTAYSNINGRGVIENWNINTGADTYAAFANYAGNSSTGDSNFRLSALFAFPKNYTNSTYGGAYAAGGTTLWMYGASDTTNNNMVFAITQTVGNLSEANYNPSFRWVKAVTNNYTIANELMRLNKTGLGIKQNTPLYSLDINATDGIRIPSGTTGQRPTGAAAVVRYNSDSLRLEYHTGTAWKGIAKTEELPAATSGFPRAAPVAVILSTYTVGATDAWIICDYAGTVTLTLPSAASYPGREIIVKTIRAQSVVSASSNVAPIDSNTAGTAILAATAGKWATLVSTGSQWIIMQSN